MFRMLLNREQLPHRRRGDAAAFDDEVNSGVFCVQVCVHAFEASEWPLILTLETHVDARGEPGRSGRTRAMMKTRVACCPLNAHTNFCTCVCVGKLAMAAILQEECQQRLYLPPCPLPVEFPSPLALKGKIVLRDKVLQHAHSRSAAGSAGSSPPAPPGNAVVAEDAKGSASPAAAYERLVALVNVKAAQLRPHPEHEGQASPAASASLDEVGVSNIALWDCAALGCGVGSCALLMLFCMAIGDPFEARAQRRAGAGGLRF
jgi:hypothetical protein